MSGFRWDPPTSVVDATWLDTELQMSRVADVMRREAALFDGLVGGPEVPLVLFGAGNLGRRTLAGLRHVGIEPLAFMDNSPALHGIELDGLAVHPPSNAVREFRSAAFISTIWAPLGPLAYPAVADQLRTLGCSRVVSFVPLFWKFSEQFLPYFMLDLPHRLYRDACEVLAAYALFSDAASQQEYRLQLSYLLSQMDAVEVSGVQKPDWYFPKDLVALTPEEVLLDCGAYDGDTLQAFIGASHGRFRRVVAFEPDPSAARRLKRLVEVLPPDQAQRVDVQECAVGATRGRLAFEGDGTPGSRLSVAGRCHVDCTTIDSTHFEDAPTFIKMDIEGSEESALLGARRSIREHRPVLAICVYHRQGDLYRIPNLMRELCTGYRMYLRRQGSDGDLVCFAIPDERARN